MLLKELLTKDKEITVLWDGTILVTGPKGIKMYGYASDFRKPIKFK